MLNKDKKKPRVKCLLSNAKTLSVAATTHIFLGGLSSCSTKYTFLRSHFYNVWIYTCSSHRVRGVSRVAVTILGGVDASTCWVRCESRMNGIAVWTWRIHINVNQCESNAHLAKLVSNKSESSLQCEHALCVTSQIVQVQISAIPSYMHINRKNSKWTITTLP